jgi:hypothetical protein
MFTLWCVLRGIFKHATGKKNNVANPCAGIQLEAIIGKRPALLGYRGAALPSDGFALVADFPDEPGSFDYITELAGVRHVHGTDLSDVSPGDEVQFAVDRENPVERDALFATHNGKPLGYVNRALRNRVAHWTSTGHLSAHIERLNEKPDRPLVYVRIEYRQRP